MAPETTRSEGEKLKEKKTKEVTFKCRFCQELKPLSEMMVITRLFPPLVACRECEKQLR